MTPTQRVAHALKRIPGEARTSEIPSFTELALFECLDALYALKDQGKVTSRIDGQGHRWWRLVRERRA